MQQNYQVCTWQQQAVLARPLVVDNQDLQLDRERLSPALVTVVMPPIDKVRVTASCTHTEYKQ